MAISSLLIVDGMKLKLVPAGLGQFFHFIDLLI